MTVLIITSCLLLDAVILLLIMYMKQRRQLKEVASLDALTGAYTRRFFMEQAEIHIARSLRLDSGCFIVIFDLDHFRAVNETHGHLAGDAVLHEISKRIRATIRPYDLLGRYGGEEFIMLICDVNRLNVITATERARMEIFRKPVVFQDKPITISASFGIAYAAPMNNLSAAIERAEIALNQAKSEGKNKIVFSEQEAD